jgi:hypothetical protein
MSNEQVGCVEPTGPASGRPDDKLRDTHHRAARLRDGFRKDSTYPTGSFSKRSKNVRPKRLDL